MLHMPGTFLLPLHRIIYATLRQQTVRRAVQYSQFLILCRTIQAKIGTRPKFPVRPKPELSKVRYETINYTSIMGVIEQPIRHIHF